MGEFLGNFISILATVIMAAIIIRALLSWFMPGQSNPFGRVLTDVTEPVIGPVRRVLPPIGGLDLSPLLAIILVQVLSSLLIQVINSTT
jgi:YggT family protein